MTTNVAVYNATNVAGDDEYALRNFKIFGFSEHHDFWELPGTPEFSNVPLFLIFMFFGDSSVSPCKLFPDIMISGKIRVPRIFQMSCFFNFHVLRGLSVPPKLSNVPLFPDMMISINFRVPPIFSNAPLFPDLMIFWNFRVPPNFSNVLFLLHITISWKF